MNPVLNEIYLSDRVHSEHGDRTSAPRHYLKREI